jgi:hypothetical protein
MVTPLDPGAGSLVRLPRNTPLVQWNPTVITSELRGWLYCFVGSYSDPEFCPESSVRACAISTSSRV